MIQRRNIYFMKADTMIIRILINMISADMGYMDKVL
jgi:hypothetical protein